VFANVPSILYSTETKEEENHLEGKLRKLKAKIAMAKQHHRAKVSDLKAEISSLKAEVHSWVAKYSELQVRMLALMYPGEQHQGRLFGCFYDTLFMYSYVFDVL
jgi:chromosome segregation ATPase